MAREKLNAKRVESLKPGPKRRQIFDEDQKGLALRISPSGVKSWSVCYWRNGRMERMTLGVYPSLKLAEARTRARDVLHDVSHGEDPRAEKIQKREAGTFQELAELYIEEHVKPNKAPRSLVEDQRQIDAYLLPVWKYTKAADVTIDDVETLLDGLKKNAPVQANRTRSLVRHIFRWALSKRSYRRRFALTVNPAADVPKPAKEESRTRVFTDPELKAIWKACDEIGTVGELFKLQLLTAARPGEVSEMEWAELELERAIWTQPGTKTKNGKVHVVPLSPQTVRILENLKGKQAKLKNPRKRESRYVFFNPRNPDVAITWLQKAASRVKEKGALAEFRPHDLRRTVATRTAEMGVPDPVLKMILNHSLGNDITGVYNQYKYFDERQQALDAWAVRLTRIVSGLRDVKSES
jgi:integrase